MKNTKAKGTIAATGVAFLQGFEGLLFPLFGIIFMFSTYQSMGFSVGTLAIKEVLTIIFMVVIAKPKNAWTTFKKLFTSSDARWFFWAGVIGTTMGNLFYIVAIQFAGSSYGVILTSLYPVFAMLLVKFMMKSSESWKVWMGVAIAVAGAALFVLLPSIVSGEGVDVMSIVGMLFGLAAAFFWAVEGTFINVGVKKESNKDINDSEAVLMRSFGTNFSVVLILMPIVSVLSYTVDVDVFSIDPFVDVVAEIFVSWKGILISLAITANLITLRMIHIKAISSIGAKLTSIISTNNFIIPALFSIVLTLFNLEFVHEIGKEDHEIYTTIVWWAWFLIIPIAVGVFIVLYYSGGEEPDIEHVESLEEELEKDIVLEHQV